MDRGLPLQVAIGRNAHEFRAQAGLTLDQVSACARRRGLKWSESRVADFEAGRVAPSLATLLAVTLALNDAGCAQATLPLLVKCVEPMRINESLTLLDIDVVRLMKGQATNGPEPMDPVAGDAAESLGWERTPFERKLFNRYQADPATFIRIVKTAGATEERIRRSLAISTPLLARLSASLWDRSFSEERDRRAGDGANAQKRGRVSRELLAELQSAIEGVRRGNNQ